MSPYKISSMTAKISSVSAPVIVQYLDNGLIRQFEPSSRKPKRKTPERDISLAPALQPP
jgi:hypothetical protein